MKNYGKHSVLGINIHAVDYEYSVEKITQFARERKSYTVSALAVHGVMTGYEDAEHSYRLNQLDLVVPDGQPVRYALGLLHGIWLEDRVAGPHLTPKVLARCEEEGLSIFLYGSTERTLSKMIDNMAAKYPKLRVVGTMPSKFKTISEEEQREVAKQIEAAKPNIVLVGLGCPRQEVWCYEHKYLIHCPTLAVGAAFDFEADELKRAPLWLQQIGMEWFFRLLCEPKRLWRRYLLLGPKYLSCVMKQKLGLIQFSEKSEPAHQGYS